jgi:ubiquitin C-terminal hydrolase
LTPPLVQTQLNFKSSNRSEIHDMINKKFNDEKLDAIIFEYKDNQCFMNSIFQVLRHSSLSKEFIVSLPNMLPKIKLSKGFSNTAPILTDFSILMRYNNENNDKIINARDSVIMNFFGKQTLDENIKPLVLDHNLKYGQQEDAKEFLDHFIDIIDHEYYKLTGKKKYISKKFIIEMNQYTVCKSGHVYLEKEIPENCLMLPIYRPDDDSDLATCIERYFRFQNCDDLSYCARCDKMVARKIQHKIQELPQILVIQLLRFGKNVKNKIIKFKTRVKFDQDICLSQYLDKDVISKNYQLKGFVQHTGVNLENGHYRCTVNVNDTWTFFDENLKLTTPNIKEYIETCTNYITPYILFYEKQENRPIEPPLQLSEASSKICGRFCFKINLFYI